MVISRTPYRMSFFGGGTDYPSWYRNHGGSVLATTINKYCYLTCRWLPPFFSHNFRIVYSKTEDCKRIEEIKHPAVLGVLKFLKIKEGVEIHHDGDLPARSGLGSSSSFTVGLLHALHALKGRMPSKKQLAEESIYVEQKVIKDTVGCQDQILAAYGGFNHVIFHRNGETTLNPITLPAKRIKELNDHLMLFYTGMQRTASEVAKSYVSNINNQEKQLQVMQSMVNNAIFILDSKSDIKLFGKLLDEAWQTKKSLSTSVSNSDIDKIYTQALSAGAIGGKIIGAGGGGCMLLFVPPSHKKQVLKKLKKLVYIPFKFEPFGSQIIFYDQQENYVAEFRRQFKEGKDLKFTLNGRV